MLGFVSFLLIVCPWLQFVDPGATDRRFSRQYMGVNCVLLYVIIVLVAILRFYVSSVFSASCGLEMKPAAAIYEAPLPLPLALAHLSQSLYPRRVLLP
jgi:hypothetical protein